MGAPLWGATFFGAQHFPSFQLTAPRSLSSSRPRACPHSFHSRLSGLLIQSKTMFPSRKSAFRQKHSLYIAANILPKSEIDRPHIPSPFSLEFPTHVATMWHPFSESKCTIFFAIHRSRRPTSSLSAPLPHHRPSTETYQQRSVSAVAPAAIRITGRG